MLMGLTTNTKSLMSFVRYQERLIIKFWSLSIDRW